jgi:hypothetical protein
VARGDSKIGIGIRYLQAKGSSHRIFRSIVVIAPQFIGREKNPAVIILPQRAGLETGI